MSETSSNKEQPEVKPTTGWFVVKWILPFFGVMIVANIIFVTFAVNTHTGMQTSNPYEEGLRHNSIIEQSRLKEELGWSVGLEVDQAGFLDIDIFDKDGVLMQDVNVEAMLFSPVKQNQDQNLIVEKTPDGGFLASFDQTIKGQKELRLRVMQGDVVVEFRRRLVIK